MPPPATFQQIDRTFVRFRNRKLSYFSGCDYFRLASHPGVIAALQSGVREYGLNVAASRLTTGNHIVYSKLERRLALFFKAEDALLVSTGYLTNLVVAQALARNFSHVLIDERAHPSLFDAARFLDCPLVKFKHRDPLDLAQSVRRCGPGSKLILLTDGMFSHDGSAAPLGDYLGALPKDALILVDDAHGAGVLGQTGKGSLEYARVDRRRFIQTITLSKAFGVYGGAILATAALRRRILRNSSLFIGSTPVPLPLASAAIEAVHLLKTDHTLRQRLIQNANYIKTALQERRSRLAASPSVPGPIISVLPKRPRDIPRLNRALLDAGIYPPLIQYPGAPAGGYFRFAISSEHTRRQLHTLLKVLLDFA